MKSKSFIIANIVMNMKRQASRLLILLLLTTGKLFAQNPYPNLDFSNLDFSNWQLYRGTASGDGENRPFIPVPYTPTFPLKGSDPFIFIYPTAQMYDPNTCYALRRIPEGKPYSVRVGPLSPGGYGSPRGYRASYALTVDASRPTFVYQFAFVQQFDHGTSGGDPSGFGGSNATPTGAGNNAQLIVRTYGSENTTLGDVCGNYHLYPGVGRDVSWFEWSKCGEISSTPWFTDVIDLTPYIGETITIEFTTMDCYTGHHMAYSYISPGSLPVDTIVRYCPGAPKTLEAPIGFRTYSWREIDGSFTAEKENSDKIGHDLPEAHKMEIPAPMPGARYECTFTSYSGCSGKLIFQMEPDSVHAAYTYSFGTDACRQILFEDASHADNGYTVQGWEWNFADAASLTQNNSSVQNPEHVFTLPGSYDVRLIATSSIGCKDTLFQTVKVTQQGTAHFNYSTSEICRDGKVVFEDASLGNIAAREWNFGDGTTVANGTVQEHIYTVAGSYQPSLKITTLEGCEHTVLKPLKVYDKPDVGFSVSEICEKAPFHLQAQDRLDNVEQWEWNFGDHSPLVHVAAPEYAYEAYGQYEISLKGISEKGCSSIVLHTALVNPLPQVQFALQEGSFQGCPPLCIGFQNNTSIAQGLVVAYEWKFGDEPQKPSAAGAAALPSGAHCYSKPGSYFVSLTARSDKGCTNKYAPVQDSVWVFDTPRADFLISPSRITIEQSEVYFQNQSTGFDDYEWTIEGAGNGSTEGVHAHWNYLYSGEYLAKLEVRNNHGCVDSLSRIVQVDSVYAIGVPNSFTPNGDGLNDVWELENSFAFPNMLVKVYNRWGNVVYESVGYTTPWDGRSRSGSDVALGTYYYIIELNSEKKEKPISGSVTIVK
jgi:gliding motility-associated-like protein